MKIIGVRDQFLPRGQGLRFFPDNKFSIAMPENQVNSSSMPMILLFFFTSHHYLEHSGELNFEIKFGLDSFTVPWTCKLYSLVDD